MGEEDMEYIKKRLEKRKRVIEEVRMWAEALEFKSTVILIGSYARGDFNEWSDIDILLIKEYESKNRSKG